MQINPINSRSVSFCGVYRAPYSEKGLKLLTNNLKDFTAPKDFINACVEHKSELHFLDIPLGIMVPNPIPFSSDVLTAFLENLKILKDGNTEKPVKYITGNHPESNSIINYIGKILGFTGITKSEAKELGMERLKDFKWEHVDKLAQLRQEKLKSKGIDISEVFSKYIYVFSDEDLKDYLHSPFCPINNMVNSAFSDKKAPTNGKLKQFTQKIADIFRKKDFEQDSDEPSWEKAIIDVLNVNKKETAKFNEFLAGRNIKHSENVEEMIESLKQS